MEQSSLKENEALFKRELSIILKANKALFLKEITAPYNG
jgi:hypothetical protein